MDDFSERNLQTLSTLALTRPDNNKKMKTETINTKTKDKKTKKTSKRTKTTRMKTKITKTKKKKIWR